MINFRKIILFVFAIMLLTPAFAQTKSTPSKDCFPEWLNLFRSRGAQPVTNGVQEVIITVRGQSGSQCYVGKIEVAEGKIKPPLWIQKDDGSFDTFGAMGKKLDPEFTGAMSEADLFAITDGMSISFRTTDGEYGRLFFYKFLSPKPKANKVAPSPSALIKD